MNELLNFSFKLGLNIQNENKYILYSQFSDNITNNKDLNKVQCIIPISQIQKFYRIIIYELSLIKLSQFSIDFKMVNNVNGSILPQYLLHEINIEFTQILNDIIKHNGTYKILKKELYDKYNGVNYQKFIKNIQNLLKLFIFNLRSRKIILNNLQNPHYAIFND